MSAKWSLLLVCMLLASPLVAFSSTSTSPPSRAEPSIVVTSEPTFINTGDPFNINATITDPDVGDSVKSVVMEYWYGHGLHTNLSMTKVTGLPQYYLTFIGPLGSTDEFHYIIRATDTFDNVAVSPMRSLTVLDNKYPKLDSDRTPTQGTTGEDLLFDMDASDNIGILDVKLAYHYTGTATFQKIPMVKGTGNTFTYSFAVPEKSKKSIIYYFEIRDKNPLTTNTPEKTIWVLDNDKPTFLLDQTPDNATTGDMLKFSILVEDNIQVVGVDVEYGYGGIDEDNPLEMPLKQGGGKDWLKELPIETYRDQPLDYRFKATDNASNINYSEVRTVAIIDNDAPKIGADLTPTTATTGDLVEFRVNLTDNLVIEKAWITLRQTQVDLENITLMKQSGITYYGTGIVPDNIDPLLYIINVQDSQGNVKAGPQRRIEIEDNDNPTFGSDLSSGSKTAGGRYSFAILAMDNIALEKVLLVYYYGTGDMKNSTMKNVSMKLDNKTYRANLTLDQGHIENLTYYFVGKDINMNWGHSPSFTFTLTDKMPPFLPTITMKFSTTAGTGREHRVTMEVIDNIRIENVQIVYKFGEGGDEMSVEMTGSREWTGLVPIPTDFVGTMLFSVRAIDHAGNVNQTIFFNVSILDMTAPVFDAFGGITITVGQSFNVKLKNLSDNVDDVSQLTITWKTNLPFALNGTDTGGIVNVPGTFKVDVVVKDRSGNPTSSGFTIWVKEVEVPPVADDDKANYGLLIAIIVVIAIIVIGVAAFFFIRRSMAKKKEDEIRAEEEAMMKEEEALKEAESKLAEEEKKQKDFTRLYGGPTPPSNVPPQMLQPPSMVSMPPTTMAQPNMAAPAPPTAHMPEVPTAITGPLPPAPQASPAVPGAAPPTDP
jgi:hypothetical protein